MMIIIIIIIIVSIIKHLKTAEKQQLQKCFITKITRHKSVEMFNFLLNEEHGMPIMVNII